ncbi:AMP-binding protein [Bacillus rubiinfantis]|uniref:AMP-binding protein n=1 Tax=Bacillus rubiinfantis TaxID=1499680 RepID=UPI0005AAA582|nr:AMP-binding protein [Bacillus rubiinfantis]
MLHPYADVVPYYDRVIANLLETCAAQRGSNTFIVDLVSGKEEISYSEMKKSVDILAANLYQIGIRKGTHVAILMPTSRDFLYLWFALAKIGAVEIPINTIYKGDTLQYLINDCDAPYLILNEEFYDEFTNISSGLKNIKTVILHGQNECNALENWETYQWEALTVYHEEILIHLHRELENDPIKHYDPACIIYTSGTTGPSKGVLITNHHLYFMGLFQADIMQYTTDDISLNFLPFYHVAAKFITLGCMISGAKMVLKKNFSVTGFWDEIQEHQITLFPAVGGILTMLYNQPVNEKEANNSVRAVYAIPAPKENYIEIQQRFGLKLVEAYGSTEWNAVTATEMEEDCPGSCGKPLTEFVDILIVDEHDHPCKPGQAGELLVRPKLPHIVMLGYYNKPEKTVEAWQNLWFHTGDRFYQDDKGYLYFLDRMKDAIRRKGENISSFEMESMLNKHPEIAESAVIAIPSPIGEDDIKACIVLKQESSLTYLDIVEYCYQNMGHFMVPRYIEFYNELPRTPTGKLLKMPLQEEARKSSSSKTWDCEKDGKIRVTSKGIMQLR